LTNYCGISGHEEWETKAVTTLRLNSITSDVENEMIHSKTVVGLNSKVILLQVEELIQPVNAKTITCA
jgi:hypothetical protein